jgi:hypothetical protein
MIRDFHRDDTQAVVFMVGELRAESPVHRNLPFDPGHVARIMNAYTVRGWVSVTAEREFRGYCFVTVVPSLLGPWKILTDLSIFVRKPYRNGIIASRFLTAMHAYGERQGVTQWQHASTTGDPSLEGLLLRAGFVRTGSTFVKGAAESLVGEASPFQFP